MFKHDFIFSVPQLNEYLLEKGLIAQSSLLTKTEFNNNFFLLIPKYYIDLIDWNDINDPLKKMTLASNLENDVKEYELLDPIGDETHSPVPGIIHRYPDRCLLMLTNICAIHCRFCFRRNLLSNNQADFEKSMKYIETHKEIWEVILSGGDPFMFTDHFLEKVITRLKSISHVKTIRFHTRTPAVYPKRITNKFVETLIKAQPLTIVFHINHPKEITEDFIVCVEKLKKSGAMMLSQTVLMKDINDDEKTLELLFKNLVRIGIKPYYLHHLDLTAGTHHFRVSLEKGKLIMQKLRGNISGVCLPEYVIDTPGGDGKIPVFWFKNISKGIYQATSFKGNHIIYKDYAL